MLYILSLIYTIKGKVDFYHLFLSGNFYKLSKKSGKFCNKF